MRSETRIEKLEHRHINNVDPMIYMKLDLLYSNVPKKYTEEEMKLYREWNIEQGYSHNIS